MTRYGFVISLDIIVEDEVTNRVKWSIKTIYTR